MEADKTETTFDQSQTLCSPLFGITRTIRDLRPTHYLFKIVSYSSLEHEKYESDVFQAGDYKWKLCLYPNGDAQRNGNGYISLYLTIAETDTLPLGWEVNANFKLFLFDQIHDKYLTIQDEGEGAIRRFHDTKTQWGFSQLIPLCIFKNVSNGYLIDDGCVFGAEVFVLKCIHFKSFCLLPDAKEPPKDTYVWKMEKISTLQNEFYYSDVFALSGREWKLKAYLKGCASGKGKAMSLYFVLDDVPKKHKVLAEFNLRIRDQIHNNHQKKTDTRLFTNSYGWGFHEFITMEELHDPSRGFVKNDTLIVEVQLTKLSLVKDD